MTPKQGLLVCCLSILPWGSAFAERDWYRYENTYFEAFSDDSPRNVRKTLDELELFRAAVAQIANIQIPDDANQLQLDWTASVQGSDVVLLVRINQPVEHSLGITGLNSTYDFLLEAGGEFDLTDPNPDTPFEPGMTYYFHPVNRGQATTEYTIDASHNGSIQSEEGGADGGSDGGIEESVDPDGGGDKGTSFDAGVDTADMAPDGNGGSDDSPCPPGYEPYTHAGGQICVPICEEGTKLKQTENGFECLADGSSGCGCSHNESSWLFWGLGIFGLLLAMRVRRRSLLKT